MPRLYNPIKTGSPIVLEYEKDIIINLHKGETRIYPVEQYEYLRKVYPFLENPDDYDNHPDAPFITKKVYDQITSEIKKISDRQDRLDKKVHVHKLERFILNLFKRKKHGNRLSKPEDN